MSSVVVRYSAVISGGVGEYLQHTFLKVRLEHHTKRVMDTELILMNQAKILKYHYNEMLLVEISNT